MDFFLENKNTMPAGSPGSLTDQEYLHLLKYMFDIADVEAPSLTIDNIASMKIEYRENRNSAPDVEWKNFGSELNAQRYVPLSEINNCLLYTSPSPRDS